MPPFRLRRVTIDIPDPASAAPPTTADLRAAAARLENITVVTPLLEAPELNARLGGRLLIKAEALQRTGSFKLRGAANKIGRLADEGLARGVVAYSSGNHAQAVAYAAKLHGMTATIVMPRDAPAIKIARTRGLGAEIVFYDRAKEDREAIAARLAAERGALLVPPYDDADIIAGQGTLGLELAGQAAGLGASLDLLMVPCGGGGLIAGCALALAEVSPGTAVYAVEPEGFDDTTRSLAAGMRVANPPGARSICDALLATTPGALTFAVNREHLAGGHVVGDGEVQAAMATAFTELKLVLEPGGAAALAAVLAGRIDCRGRTVAVVASGGNVDPEVYCAALAAAGREGC